MQELRDKEAEDRQRAQLIEANLVEIDALLDLIRTSRKNSMDWEELTRSGEIYGGAPARAPPAPDVSCQPG